MVEAKRRLFDIYDVIHQLRRYRGNFKYVALPDGEYFSWEGLVDKAIKRSFGLSTSLGNFTCFDISSLRGLVPLLNQSGGEYEKGF